MTTRFFSDLTDTQWERVRSGAFPNDSSADGLRRAVDALLFRERAWCPWELMPADLPPADDLRRRAAEWAADGTWGRVRSALAEPPAPAPPPGLRRRLAAAVRRLPGGSAALVVPRLAVQLVQHLRSRKTSHARLPAVFREGVGGLEVRDFVTATDRFTSVLALHPTNADALLNRGVARLQLGDLTGAREDGLLALTVPGLALPPRVRANDQLAEAYLRLGDLDRAVGHAYLARLLARYGEDAPWRQDELAEEPDEFELLAEAHGDVAAHAINFASDFDTAARVYARQAEIRRRYERWLAEVPARTHYLPADWVRNVGHMGLIDAWVKMHRLGWVGGGRVVLSAPPDRTANRVFAEYLKSVLKVVPEVGPGGATAHLATALGPRVAGLLRLPGGERKYFIEAAGAVQEEWERQGRGPLLALTDEDRAFGEARLRAMGVPAGAWFVSLHVRSPGFYNEAALPHNVHRDADIASYLPLIHEVVRRGGWVVRVGDRSMPPLPPTPGAVDYATGPHKGERMDVFLCAACRFFVGVASGLCHLPTAFGVPSLLTNWISNALPGYGRHDRFVPKLVWSGPLGRVLTFDEWLHPANRSRYVLATEMAKAGLRPMDNTTDELAAAAGEMIDRLDGREVPDPADDARRAAFDRLARGHGLVGFARPARDFLRRHEGLLPAAARKAG